MANARTTKTNPVAAEATGAETLEFEYDGETYGVRPTSSWSLDALEAFEDGRIASLLREVLAPGDYARFRKGHNTVAELTELVEAMQDVLGVAGN